jgi:hypothetical protein
MVIESDNGCFRAILDDGCDDGVSVTFWRRGLGELGWKSLWATIIDCPFHVALDCVHEVVNELHPKARAWPTRFRVLSVDGRPINPF